MGTITTKWIVESVNENIESIIKGRGNIENTIVDNVSSGVAIRAVVETGKNLDDSVKALVIGILKGWKSMGAATFLAIIILARTIIKITVDRQADVAAVTRGLISGIIHSAKDLGIDVGKAASVAATGAENAAYKISEDIGNKVKNETTRLGHNSLSTLFKILYF